jgi:hypothetical protein
MYIFIAVHESYKEIWPSHYGHLFRAMVINNELESFAENKMQTYLTIICTLH